MPTIIIKLADGQSMEVEADRSVIIFLEENDRYIQSLAEIDSKEFKMLHFDKPAWENMHSLSTVYSAEDEYLGIPESRYKAERDFYRMRLAECRRLLPLIQNACTETQWRRFVLHKVHQLTTRQIAEAEQCRHQAVVKSISAVERKIKEVLSR